jgi:sulfur carrier protein ThiS adenylyltransferase
MNIFLNGKNFETESTTLFQLLEEFKTIRQNNDSKLELVCIKNGFHTKENLDIKNNDFITIIAKGLMPDYNELESLMSSRHTPGVYNCLKKSRVAIAGLGGLGSNIAVMLARIGVGELFLVDFDIVEPSNLNRQSYYIRHLGMLKTEAIKEQLKEINPFIEIITKSIKVDSENINILFKDYDIICEAFDNPESKACLVENILLNFPDKKIVAASGMAGYESSNKIKTKNFMKNLYLCGDFENEAKEGNGLMAPRVQICAGHQANMILRLILKEFEP